MTRAIKIGKHYFKYDRDKAVVKMYSKIKNADELAEMKKDNEEWQAKYGHDLWDLEDDLIYLDGAGLSREHWDNKEARRAYLEQFEYDHECELQYLV